MRKINIDLNILKPTLVLFNTNKINILYGKRRRKKKLLNKYYLKKNIFYKLNFFLNKLNINKSIFFNILLVYFKNIYNLYLRLFNINLYYNLLKLILVKYINIFELIDIKNNNNCVLNNNFVFYPNSILINVNKKLLNNCTYSLKNVYNFEKFMHKKLLRLKSKNSLNQEKNELNLHLKNKYFVSTLLNNNYHNSKFKLNFLRVQRRYNKRRYSKVRVSSRNSFLAGISLSSVFLAILWGGSIKKVDWLTSKLIVIDVNLVIITFILYFIYRTIINFYPTLFIRKKNKIKILNTIQNLFILNIWLNN